MQPQGQCSAHHQCGVFASNCQDFPQRSGLLEFLEYCAMSMDPMLPAPAYGYGRKRTESRRMEGSGRSEYTITHRHGSEYQKQSIFASAQHQAFPSPYSNHRPFIVPHPAPPPDRHYPPHVLMHPGYHDPQLEEDYGAEQRFAAPINAESKHREKGLHAMSISSSNKLSSSDISDMDHRLPRSLKFTVSLARSDSAKSSSVPLTQTLETGIGHEGVKRLNNTREGEYKVYKDKIFNVWSSRYTKFLNGVIPVEAGLVLQPPPRPNQKSRYPLLTWM